MKEYEPLVYLGLCDQVIIKAEGLTKDFFNVRDFLAPSYLPQKLEGMYLLFAIPTNRFSEIEGSKIMLKDKNDPTKESFVEFKTTKTIEGNGIRPINLAHKSFAYHNTEINSNQTFEGQGFWYWKGVSHELLPIPFPPLWIMEPTTLEIIVIESKGTYSVGSVDCQVAPPPPLTEEEKRAIISRPDAIKVLGLILDCKKCKNKGSFYLSLIPEISTKEMPPNSISLDKASDVWECKCGHSQISLIYAKQGLHALFRHIPLSQKLGNVHYFPKLYEMENISALINEYEKLLKDNISANENVFQEYLEKYPIFWSFLHAAKIWNKPPILTKHQADFAILSQIGTLFFIEIEKPSTKMIKSKGGIHSELQSGLDQIRDWKIEIDQRRDAVLHGLNLQQNEVRNIEYVLVAGMAKKISEHGMSKIRGLKNDSITVLCFDELSYPLRSIIMGMQDI